MLNVDDKFSSYTDGNHNTKNILPKIHNLHITKHLLYTWHSQVYKFKVWKYLDLMNLSIYQV